MRLLVSVASAGDARAALEGGADIIDAKDPARGALGCVEFDVLHAIATVVAGKRPLTAALGDAADAGEVERTACAYAAAGAVLVKVGFAGMTDTARVAMLLTAAIRGARAAGARAVAVAYADADGTSVPVVALAGIAARAGAAGLLIDTMDKDGPGVRALLAPPELEEVVAAIRARGLFAAVAGRLLAADLPYARDAGADIVGVRGAACEGGRRGYVVAERVRQLRELCAPARQPH